MLVCFSYALHILRCESFSLLFRCFSVVFQFMASISLPRHGIQPIQKDGYWIARWRQSHYSTVKGSDESPTSVKLLNYVCLVLENIVDGLNKNFQKIRDYHNTNNESQRSLHSKVDALKVRVDQNGDDLREINRKLDILINGALGANLTPFPPRPRGRSGVPALPPP